LSSYTRTEHTVYLSAYVREKKNDQKKEGSDIPTDFCKKVFPNHIELVPAVWGRQPTRKETKDNPSMGKEEGKKSGIRSSLNP